MLHDGRVRRSVGAVGDARVRVLAALGVQSRACTHECLCCTQHACMLSRLC